MYFKFVIEQSVVSNNKTSLCSLAKEQNIKNKINEIRYATYINIWINKKITAAYLFVRYFYPSNRNYPKQTRNKKQKQLYKLLIIQNDIKTGNYYVKTLFSATRINIKLVVVNVCCTNVSIIAGMKTISSQ